MTAVMKTEEGMGIEYDEDIVCDVCCSPDSEDTNEMVFCDGCDVCIHQACYGIQSIPEGSWLCRTCALGIKPSCMLCPKVGGAMKSTRSGTKWAHVSCALWIPEVSIGIPEKMEPITKISNIPPSRWALVCCLCKERVGACIQCSVKTCKTAFHVTCGFSNGLEMRTVLDETDEKDGVKLKAYCPKHTKKRERGHSESDTDSPRKESPPTPKKEMTQQERENFRAQKLKSLEENFNNLVDVSEICESLQLEEEIVEVIYVYWKLKRKCNWDKPLLTPKTEEADMLEKQQEDSLVARMKMFVHLRQDLERVRNLCYMIGKREKTKRQFFRSKEYVFTSMVRVLLDKSLNLSNADVDDIVHNYHFDSIYDDYGLSVQHLPPEPSQDEGHSAEVDIKEEKVNTVWDQEEKGDTVWETEEKGTVDNQQEMEGAMEDVVEETPAEVSAVVEEEEIEDDPALALPPGERWSGEFVRSGFFMRRHPKNWMKGAMKKKKLPPIISSPESSTPAVSVKPEEKVHVEDDNVFTSNDESDEDKEKLAAVVKAIVDKSDDDGDFDQPLIPKLVVKSPKNKSHSHSDHHRKRHRGRKPWHMKETYKHSLHLNSSEDEDMKVEPIVERRKENQVTKVEDTLGGSDVLDVVGCEDGSKTSEQQMIVDVEGEDASIQRETLQFIDTTHPLSCRQKTNTDSTHTASNSAKKKKKSERSLQKLFDKVTKESEGQIFQSSERTKQNSNSEGYVTESENTEKKSHGNELSHCLKKLDRVKEKRDRNRTLNKVTVMLDHSVPLDSSPVKCDEKQSEGRLKSSKSKLKSGSTNIEDAKTPAEFTFEEDRTRKYDSAEVHRKRKEKERNTLEKRKEKEGRHKRHESSSSSRRPSRREHRKSGHSESLDCSISQPVLISNHNESLESSKAEPLQKPCHNEYFNSSESEPIPKSPLFDPSGPIRRKTIEKTGDKTSSHDSKMWKSSACEEVASRESNVFKQKASSLSFPSEFCEVDRKRTLSLPSVLCEVDRKRTKKGKSMPEKEKSRDKPNEPAKSFATSDGSKRKSGFGHSGSSGKLSNIFERMELSTSISAAQSNERSNIFESMERHCREGSFDMGLKCDNIKVTKSLKSQTPIDWPNKVDFHFGSSVESSKLSQSSDHWFAGGTFKNNSHVEENVLTSDVLDCSPTPFLDKSMKTETEKEGCQLSKSVLESLGKHSGSIPPWGEAGNACNVSCEDSKDAYCQPDGDATSQASENVSCQLDKGMPNQGEENLPGLVDVENSSCQAAEKAPSQNSNDVICQSDEDIFIQPDESVLSQSKLHDVPCKPVEDVLCKLDDVSPQPDDIPSQPDKAAPYCHDEDTPCHPNENTLKPGDENASHLSNESAPCLSSEGAMCQLNEDIPCLSGEDGPCPPKEDVADLTSEDVPALSHVPSLSHDDVTNQSVEGAPLLSDEDEELLPHKDVPTQPSDDVACLPGEGVPSVPDENIENHEEIEGETPSSASTYSADPCSATSVLSVAENHVMVSSGLPEESQLNSPTNTASNTNLLNFLEGRLQSDQEVIKMQSNSNLSNSRSKHHRKRSHKGKDRNRVVETNTLERSQKSTSQVEGITCRIDLKRTEEKLPRRSSVHVEDQLENSDSPEPRIRICRKSSHEARLKLNKVLTAPDTSSDDDFEPAKPVMTMFPRRERHDRHTKKLILKRRATKVSSEELSDGEDTDEDEGNRRRSKRRKSHHWDSREQSLQPKDFLGKSSSRTRTDSIHPELTRLLKPSDLVIDDVLVKRVEDSLLHRYNINKNNHRYSYANGILDDRQPQEQKVVMVGKDSRKRSRLSISKEPSRQLGSSEDRDTLSTRPLFVTRILNEITPERSGNFQTNLFGAHYTPRGSLSGYRIPKKSSNQSAAPPASSSPQQVSPTLTGPFSGGADFSSFKSLAAAGPLQMYPRAEGALPENSLKKGVGIFDGASDLEATSTVSSDHFEGQSLSVDVGHGYRSGSPASEASMVLARQSDSRESTPRRFTRSQLADELVENSPSNHGVGANGSNKMKLRDGLLKISNFTS